MGTLLQYLENWTVPIFLLSSMLAIGLKLTPAAILAPLRDARLVILVMILNFAVADKRRGTGTAMITKLKTKLSLTHRNKLMMELRESNLDGCNFLKAMGFRAISILRDFYEEHTTEDAFLFQYRYKQEEPA